MVFTRETFHEMIANLDKDKDGTVDMVRLELERPGLWHAVTHLITSADCLRTVCITGRVLCRVLTNGPISR